MSVKKISILLIEDNRLLREGISAMLKKQPDMNVIATFGNGENILVEVAKRKPNIVLLDLGLRSQSSLKIVKLIKKQFEAIKIIVMDLIPLQTDVLEFVQAEVSGFILKDANITDFYKQKVDAQFIGLAPKQKKLERNIAKRLMQRLKQGMVREVSKLHAGGLSWKRLESFGLEYKWLALFLQKKITRAEMLTNLKRDIIRYAKRQMRWFKRNPNIRWRTN